MNLIYFTVRSQTTSILWLCFYTCRRYYIIIWFYFTGIFFFFKITSSIGAKSIFNQTPNLMKVHIWAHYINLFRACRHYYTCCMSYLVTKSFRDNKGQLCAIPLQIALICSLSLWNYYYFFFIIVCCNHLTYCII